MKAWPPSTMWWLSRGRGAQRKSTSRKTTSSTWGWPGWQGPRCCWWGISTGAGSSPASTAPPPCWRTGSGGTWLVLLSTSSGGMWRFCALDLPRLRPSPACRWWGWCPGCAWILTTRTASAAVWRGGLGPLARRKLPSSGSPASPTLPTLPPWKPFLGCRCGMSPAWGSWGSRISSSCRGPKAPSATCYGCGKTAWRRR